MKNPKNSEGNPQSEKRDSPSNKEKKNSQEIPEQPDSAYRFPKSGKQDIFGRSVPDTGQNIRPSSQ